MPSKGKYLALFIINFVMGVLWGLLSINGFVRLNNGINSGNVELAQSGAKKIKTMFIVGLIVNIVIIVAYVIIFAVAAGNS